MTLPSCGTLVDCRICMPPTSGRPPSPLTATRQLGRRLGSDGVIATARLSPIRNTPARPAGGAGGGGAGGAGSPGAGAGAGGSCFGWPGALSAVVVWPGGGAVRPPGVVGVDVVVAGAVRAGAACAGKEIAVRAASGSGLAPLDPHATITAHDRTAAQAKIRRGQRRASERRPGCRKRRTPGDMTVGIGRGARAGPSGAIVSQAGCFADGVPAAAASGPSAAAAIAAAVISTSRRSSASAIDS